LVGIGGKKTGGGESGSSESIALEKTGERLPPRDWGGKVNRQNPTQGNREGRMPKVFRKNHKEKRKAS